MNAITIILVLIVGVVVTHWFSRALGGRIALPLVQIAAGAAIGLTTSFGVKLEPEMFFVLFLPPLLFLDGWRVPKQDLQDNAVTILALAFGLVFLTVLGVGLLLNLMIPAMPLPVCFALAAVLSPTDVVAATAMVTNVPIPRRVLRILEGEALFNDASGLVCLRLAVTVAMTGTFPIWSSIADLVWAAAGGIAIGLAFSRMISLAKMWIARRIGEDTSSQILISLLTPYGAYLLADAVHGSPVLAAVAAGIMMSRIELSAQTLAVTRIRRNAVWETLQFALNGSIFLLLGEQLPGIVARLHASSVESGHAGLGWLAMYVLAVSVALAVLRFGWVWVSITIWLRRHAEQAGGRRKPDWRLTLAMSTAGVRGAVTLAGALSLPLALPDGAPFPSRDLAILIAAGVILVSLLLANASLPSLLRGVSMPLEPHPDQQERDARIEAAKAAIAALARAGAVDGGAKGDSLAAVAQVADYYQHRLAQLQPEAQALTPAGTLHEEERLHVVGLTAERAAIVNLARGHRITADLAHKLLREIDLAEEAFQTAADG
ncbi:CPA1 family monovalent cation:H+ antiporter [Angulomicrobium tetraedrale]|uniref:CPA1 family monovalent cation:H+ antiporter n=1 Tax=Ancylobacter tetraedralis TaxID=217068 RepID=A0A839ZCZ9_9HYPH|nr:Na+/H+ antiporter [Ancylobacter tetraedralis]MBB3772614.1 CPA1 family monovalent cation:H+ antiporter [Ancylobacter tetraedralis]